MQKYAEYRPTQFDPQGAFLDDRDEWLVVPVIQTRDSGPFDQSNFAAALEMLGGESETVEVHRFGHWGPGWFEIIIVDPSDAKAVGIANDIESSLEDYPILNDEDFSRREWEEYETGWDNYARKDFICQLKKDFDLSESAADLLDDCDSGRLREFFENGVTSGEYYIGESHGVSVNLRSFDCSREKLAALLRELRQVKV